MKAVAYSVKSFEKEFLAKANQKKHDITLISNSLSPETTIYAEGKDAVIVFTTDDVTAPVIESLAGLGVKFIITRSSAIDHIDTETAGKFGIKLANIPSYSRDAYLTKEASQEIADQIIKNLDEWQNHKCVGDALCLCQKL